MDIPNHIYCFNEIKHNIKTYYTKQIMMIEPTHNQERSYKNAVSSIHDLRAERLVK